MEWPLVELPVNPSPLCGFLEFSNPPTTVASDRGGNPAHETPMPHLYYAPRGTMVRTVLESMP